MPTFLFDFLSLSPRGKEIHTFEYMYRSRGNKSLLHFYSSFFFVNFIIYQISFVVVVVFVKLWSTTVIQFFRMNLGGDDSFFCPLPSPWLPVSPWLDWSLSRYARSVFLNLENAFSICFFYSLFFLRNFSYRVLSHTKLLAIIADWLLIVHWRYYKRSEQCNF